MAVRSVNVPEIGLVNLYKRKGSKSIRLSVGHDGSIRVSMPHWVSYEVGIRFAYKQREWIKSKVVASKLIKNGHLIGKTHRIVFVPQKNRLVSATRITTTGEVRIMYPDKLDYSEPSVQLVAEKASIRSLKVQAEELLPHRLAELANRYDFAYRNVVVKQLRSRWGSCSIHNDIALNCFLMQLPWHLIDYVLLHELVHTKIMEHGAKFWNELSRYVPELKVVRKEMKDYHPTLTPISIISDIKSP